jgi:dienelactone hydrolase
MHAIVLFSTCLFADTPPPEPGPHSVEKGTIHFAPLDDQHEVPERYRLAAKSFDYQLTFGMHLANSNVDVLHLKYPSPVVTACAENNTVYAEYYRPRRAGRLPGTVILDITAGDQRVSRMIAQYIAAKGIAGLCVHMPYYGPRRPPGSRLRMISSDYEHSMEAVRQAVLDMRVAGAWLAARPEIDPNRLGILGTSLGSFMGALTAEMEPRFRKVVVLLGGGGVVDAYYDDARAGAIRETWEALGGTKKRLEALIAPADPLTCAANLKGRDLLIIAGKRDTIVPPQMPERLWEATGRQEIVWYDCDHFGAVLYFGQAMKKVIEHFEAGPKK